MRKLSLLLLSLISLAGTGLAQQQWQGTGQINGRDAQVYLYVCKPSATAALPVPAPICKPDSADLATIYTSSGLSTAITQPLSIAAGAQGTWWVPTAAGDYRVSYCTVAGTPATGSADQVDPSGCVSYYIKPSCGALTTNVEGQYVCSVASALPAPTASPYYSSLDTTNGGSWAQAARPHVFQCAAGHTAQTNTSYSTTGTWTTGTNTMTVASATNLAVGQYVYSAAGIVSGTTVTAISGTTITLSINTNATEAAVAVVFTAPLTLCSFTLPANYVTSLSAVRIWGTSCTLSAVTGSTMGISIAVSGGANSTTIAIDSNITYSITAISIEGVTINPGNGSDTNSYIHSGFVTSNSATIGFPTNTYASNSYYNWANPMTFALSFIGQQAAGASAPAVSNCMMNLTVEQP